MRLSLKIFVVAISFCPILLQAQKPILPDFHADPSIHFWDGKFWLYPSTDEAGSTSWKEMRRWNSFSSTDLVHWKDEGEIFDLAKGDISWAKNSAFAPDAAQRNAKYYFFFPAEFQIGVAVADKPQGPFKDALGKPLIKKDEIAGVKSFDPCIFIDDDNTPYLYYGGGGGVAVVKLKDNLIEKDGEVRKLPMQGYGEGIWVHKYMGLYYFSYPSHIKRDGKIKQLLVYSTSSTPFGPFKYGGAFLDNNGRNSHHSIIQIKGKSYLFYHIEGVDGYQRRVCVDYLHYNKDGSIKEVKMTNTGIKALKLKV